MAYAMAILTEDIVHLVLQELVRERMPRRLANVQSEQSTSLDVREITTPWPYSEVKACALVCRTWLNPARRLLYRGIRISSDRPTDHGQLDRLHQTLVNSPPLTGLVKVVWLVSDVNGEKASDLLHRLPKLEELYLQQDVAISLEIKPLQQKSLKILHVCSEVPVHLGKLLIALAPTLESLLVRGPLPLGSEKLSFESLSSLALLQRGKNTYPTTAGLSLFDKCPKLRDLRISYDGPTSVLGAFTTHLGSQIVSFRCYLASHEIRCDIWPNMRNLLHLTLDDVLEAEDIPHLPESLQTLQICHILYRDALRTLLDSLSTPSFLPCLKAIPHVTEVNAEQYTSAQSYKDERSLATEDVALRDGVLVHLKNARKLPFMAETLESPSIWDVDPASRRSWTSESAEGSDSDSQSSYDSGSDAHEGVEDEDDSDDLSSDDMNEIEE